MSSIIFLTTDFTDGHGFKPGLIRDFRAIRGGSFDRVTEENLVLSERFLTIVVQEKFQFFVVFLFSCGKGMKRRSGSSGTPRPTRAAARKRGLKIHEEANEKQEIFSRRFRRIRSKIVTFVIFASSRDYFSARLRVPAAPRSASSGP